MTKKIKKLIPMTGKQLITLIAAFLAAVTFGFLGEIETGRSPKILDRKGVGQEISRIIRTLRPVLKPDIESKLAGNFLGHAPEKIILAAQAGIIKKFPDGAWKLDANVTWGESVHYLAEVVRFINKNLRYKQNKIEINLTESKNKWLASDLKILSEIGVLNSFANINKHPESSIDISELRKISSDIISYFSSKIFILQKNEGKLKITSKGVFKPLSLENWQLSFDNKKWYKLPKDGSLPILEDVRIMTLYFRHSDFLIVGPVKIPTFRPMTAFIKVRTNYRKFVRNRLETMNAPETSNEKIDLKRIKKRLYELKKQRGIIEPKVASKINLVPVTASNVEDVSSKAEEKQDKKQKNLPDIKNYQLKEEKNNYSNSNKSKQTENKITVKGRVFDGLNNKPLNSAMVLADKKTISLNEEGLFSLKADKNDVIKFTAYCEGYKVLEMKHRVTRKDKPLNIPLKPELTMFSGRVLSMNNNNPVVGAIIKIKEKTAKSNAHGIFTIRGIKPGYHQISCSARNYLEAHEIIFVSKNQKNLYRLKIRKAFSRELD
ncbi:MAG: hypothetical protein ACQETH_12140 [Candidatus Rifleibacteriota bacterium]